MLLKPGAHSGSLGKGAFCSHQYLRTDLATLLQQACASLVETGRASRAGSDAAARSQCTLSPGVYLPLWRRYVFQARVILVEGGTGCTLSPRAQTST